MKRVAITGDRNWIDAESIFRPLSQLPPGSFVVLGDAHGADTLARKACLEIGLPCVVKDAEWAKYGRAAGPIRNEQMLDELLQGPSGAEREVWYFHNNLSQSKGTANCVKQARRRGIRVLRLGVWPEEGVQTRL